MRFSDFARIIFKEWLNLGNTYCFYFKDKDSCLEVNRNQVGLTEEFTFIRVFQMALYSKSYFFSTESDRTSLVSIMT